MIGTACAYGVVLSHTVFCCRGFHPSFKDFPMSANALRVSLLRGFVFLLGLTLAVPVDAGVVTSFDGASLDPNIHLDVPNAGDASITFDGVNGELDFFANGNVNMWNTRTSVPFAWTPKPIVNSGETWWVETEVRYNTTQTDGAGRRIAGITFYSGPDNTGGANDGMEFTYGLDHWDGPYGVRVQGLGDNAPGDSANLLEATPIDSVFLRTEVTESSYLDTYRFLYKFDATDTWTLLGSINASFDNSRVALFLKGDPGTDPNYLNASFTYLDVGPADSVAVPEIDPAGMGSILALVSGALGLLERRRVKSV